MAGVHVSNRKKDNDCDAEEANECIDFSYMDLDECETSMDMALASCDRFGVERILINNNFIRALSSSIYQFRNLVMLNVSSNRLSLITDEIFMLNKLKVFIGSDNLFNDMSLPKNFSDHFNSLEIINLNGNQFKNFPYQLLQMENLQEIHLGANLIETLPKDYENLYNLEVLYLGGNRIHHVPEELTKLQSLKSLNLSCNNISVLSGSLANLKRLEHLALHNNNLTTLPVELVKLNLVELSLRNNPLVSRFVRDMDFKVPTLMELSGRIIKTKNVPFLNQNLPSNLISYLSSAHHCLNPKCKGVYFTSKVEHVKFVDFCGKYRLPLMQYLCSTKCNRQDSSSESDSDPENTVETSKLKKILFG